MREHMMSDLDEIAKSREVSRPPRMCDFSSASLNDMLHAHVPAAGGAKEIGTDKSHGSQRRDKISRNVSRAVCYFLQISGLCSVLLVYWIETLTK